MARKVIPYLMVILAIPLYAEQPQRLVEIGLRDHDEIYELTKLKLTIIDAGEGCATAILTDEEIRRVEAKGLKVKVLLSDYRKSIEFIREQPHFGHYHTYDELVAELNQIANDHSSIARLDTIGYSVEGRLILAVKISDNPNVHENEPGVRLIGAHHGNEIISVEIPLYMLNYLTDNYATNPQVRTLVDNREIWAVPMLNPDGVELGQRWNANGVDLNRDYGYMWEGWGGSLGPFSQPETKTLRAFSQNHRFVLALDYHSIAEYVNYLWDYTPITAQDGTLIVDLANGYADSTGYTPINGWSWYEVHGSCQDAGYGLESILDYTIETPQPPDPDPVCENNVGAILLMIKRAGEGIFGVVGDAGTGEPLEARLNILEIDWPVYTNPELGDYHRILLPGTYTVEVSANGYLTQVIPDIIVNPDTATELDIALEPGGGCYGHKLVWALVADPNDVYSNHTLTPACLGEPDGEFLSIGVDGEVVLDMGGNTPVVDTTGNDFTVYEGDDGIPDEGYGVHISNTWNGPWTFLGTGHGTESFDIGAAGFTQARYVRIRDDGNGNPDASTAGFDLDGIEATIATGIEETQEARCWMQDARLMQNYPNPFSAATTISYQVQGRRALNHMFQGRAVEEQRSRGEGETRGRGDVSAYQRINLSIYDLAGRLIKTLVDGEQKPGLYKVVWDGRDSAGRCVVGGVYFYRFSTGQFESTKKMVGLK